MNITIPLYVEERKRPGEPAPLYVVRPLFFPSLERKDELLSRATSKLAGDLRKHLDDLGRQMRHDSLTQWTFLPEYSEQNLTLRLELRRTTPTCKALFVTFSAMDRKLAFSPALPAVWFDLTKGQSLKARATEVLSAYFRKVEKGEEDGGEVVPVVLTDPPRAWTTTIDLDVHPRQKLPKTDLSFFLSLGAEEEADGRQELERVGRCLDWQYPDELDRVILRDAEVDELTRLLAETDKRPVLLVGRRMVGKTAVVHECVFRRVQKQPSPYTRKHNVWLIAPQRLISGMSFVGQWENRLLAILKEAKSRDHVLYFDDLLGLYLAGQASNSDMSVAHVMRPYIERRDVRVLAEITPESLRVLRERDRGFADLFHIVPIPEPTEHQTFQILIESMRQMESGRRCSFDLDVLPTVIDLQRRYVRDVAMPGKAAGFFRRLATKYKNKSITRDTVLDEFRAQSGLSLSFLDHRKRLERADVSKGIGDNVIGQADAVEAMADTIAVAKARLNDPGRPLASFLFLGPTGVGKTQAAKALAAYLFGDAERLVRFDMNEYVDAGSASRLVGTFAQPEGLLTSAVQRQPFCVVLLDEIEKADLAIHDLLLQVLGEGRLTDSLGRTADFGNAIIILTSNLGVREASAGFGLRPSQADRSEAFIAAAQKFFRPEFFNRLDRIIPFRPLDRADIASIAQGLIRGVFERDGLLQRKCLLQVDPAAMDKIVEQGFDPLLGARALKRAIERQLTSPVAATLAALPPGTPTVISVYPSRDGIAVHTQEIVGIDAVAASASSAPAAITVTQIDLSDVESVMERMGDAVGRIDAIVAASQPTEIVQGALAADHYRYFALRDQAERVSKMMQHVFDRIDAASRPKTRHGGARRRAPDRVKHHRLKLSDLNQHSLWKQIAASDAINQFLVEVTDEAVEIEDSIEEHARQVIQEAALLETMAGGSPDSDRVLIHIRALSEVETFHQVALRNVYETLFDRRYGFATTSLNSLKEDQTFARSSELLVFEMPGAASILAGEVGTHLFFLAGGQILPVQVMVIPLAIDDDPTERAKAHVAERRAWRLNLAQGKVGPNDDPWKLAPVTRVYDGESGTIDLASGLVAKSSKVLADDVRTFLLNRLPVPLEVM